MPTPLPGPARVSSKPTYLRLVGGVEDRPSVDELIDAAQAAERQGARDEARGLYERALYTLRAPARPEQASAILRWIARTYQVDANFDAALDCLTAALAVADAAGDEAGVGHAINGQATVRIHQGELDEADRLYRLARTYAQRSGESKLAAMTAQNLGVVANVRGDLRQALGHYQASLADYRQLGLARDVCFALNNTAKVYTELARWAEAEAAYEEAIQICTGLGDLTTLITLRVNLAELWIARGAFDRAREACDRAAALARQTGDTHADGEAQKVYGIVAREASDYQLAERSLARAEQIATERQNLLLLAETVREQAVLYGRQGRNRDTLQCLNRAHRLFSQLKARRALADIDRQTGSLERDFLEVVQRWGASIESKDQYTQGHCERVADLACALAARAGIDGPSLFWFRIGALLHDVGKLVIPTEVLNKPGRLTEEEWALVVRHPAAGVEMLADVDFPWDVRPMVRHHHERWDGGGYPDGLRGEDIPLTARILCVADVYDALTSDRSYKLAFSHADAMEVMRRDVGRVFDPALFPLFEDIVRTAPPRPHATSVTPPAPAAPPPGPHHGETDDLTGVLTRRAFLDAAGRALAGRGSAPAALLVIDVDHFKLVNDTFGHLQGDDVLRGVAEVLRDGAGDGVLVGRYAGDEFVAFLPAAGAAEAQQFAEQMRAGVERRKYPVRDRAGTVVSVSLSIGVAAAPEHGDAVEPLFAAADQALFAAKRQGRNAVAVARKDGDTLRQPQLQLDRFVGRVDELRRLVRHLDASARGEPAVVSIEGEAGVGKSTLLRQLAPEVRLRGGALVLGRCLEADAKPPYGPWADVLTALRGLNLVSERPWRELPRLVPSLAHGWSGGDDAAAAPAGAQGGNKYALYEELTEYLSLAAAARPLVVVLDDMQWADAATWDALEHLLARLERDRVLLCLTVRSEDARGDAVERRRRLSRDERFHALTLSRLTRDELRAWLAATFHDDVVAEGLLGLLYRHTEGNALFVVQVLRTLLDEGAIWHTGERWASRPVSELQLPVAVTELIARRLDRLSAQARSALTVAAVVGRVFDVDLVVAAGAGTEDELLDAIDEGVAAAVLEPSAGRGGDRFAFAHALLVDAMRRTANPRRLRRTHERVAAALEASTPTAVGEIAAHYDQAGVADKAYRYALLAGARAADVYAHEEATAFLEMAARHAASPAELAPVHLRLAEVAEAAGDYAKALSLCEMVLAPTSHPDPVDRPGANAPAAGGPAVDRPAVNPAFSLEVRRMRERLRGLQGQPPQQTLTACRALLREAEGAGAEEERVALIAMISHAHTRLGEWAAAEALARECVELAERTGDRRLLADATTRLGVTLVEAKPLEAVELYRRALAIFTEVDDRRGQTRCYINKGVAWLRAGRASEAEQSFVAALDIGRAARAPDLTGLASLNAGVLSARRGRDDEAHARLAEALRLFTAVRNEPYRLGTLYNMAHVALDRRDAPSALTLYQQAAELASSIGQPDVEAGALAGAGLATLALGRGEAAECVSSAVAALVGGRAEWWFQGREIVEALSVRAAVAVGDATLAETRFHASVAMAEQHDQYGAAWLVAECASALAAGGARGVWDVVARFAPIAAELGFVPLASRYAALAEEREALTAGRA